MKEANDTKEKVIVELKCFFELLAKFDSEDKKKLMNNDRKLPGLVRKRNLLKGVIPSTRYEARSKKTSK